MNKQEVNMIHEEAKTVTTLNPHLQPIYADHIIKLAMDTNSLKMVLGYRVNNEVVNNATVVLPMNVLFKLQDALNGFFSDPNLQQAILESAEEYAKGLKDRFEDS